MQFILDTLGKIGFEWQMALFNLINFLILFWILKRYAFGPVMKVLKQRHKEVSDSVENIQKAKTELQMSQQKSQQLIDEAKVEANGVVEAAHEHAKKLSGTMKEKAKEEIELLISQAKKNIDIDKEEMREDLRKETAQLVVAAVEKVIGEKFDKKKDEAFISKMVSSIK
ncbi:MAG: F0F1 ATP synthase subunit B [Candidatus Magasanikbacteria bacterium]|jgi:F-type H+-transporting ATPase subunit b|nr:F0F1 ATP synthase subunit B [Candidatus Magasanikbacteria bacterium]MBT4221378.1 F0F1 ATP synthase subunit B [Candidatus Magasanikbacteria bacterium]MBT4350774.1 F0F1 ATP synthase subunit B [Candidatus Magasanikbacteria bacterium]MBT4541550.1 F0F1 ATP synthase subunit B [Candidatus Magasanikbacteria bacterium]MBT6253502.1 F0F1 ATP synthase subunit B [Candidatus Magasanikbacteria bacterium]